MDKNVLDMHLIFNGVLFKLLYMLSTAYSEYIIYEDTSDPETYVYEGKINYHLINPSAE